MCNDCGLPDYDNYEITTYLDSLKSIAHYAFRRMRQNKWRPADQQLSFNEAWFMELDSSEILLSKHEREALKDERWNLSSR